MPVQRLKARENVLGSEKPSRYEVSTTERLGCLRYFRANCKRVSCSRSMKLVPSSFNFRCRVRLLTCRDSAICSNGAATEYAAPHSRLGIDVAAVGDERGEGRVAEGPREDDRQS